MQAIDSRARKPAGAPDQAPQHRPLAFDEYMADDFDRLSPRIIERCLRLDGRRVFISGATGFFGKNILGLLAYLQRRGACFRVTALSRDPGHFLDLQPWCRAFDWLDWVKGDASDEWCASGRYDYVLHAATETAAVAHVDKLRLFEQILAGTRKALDFAARHGVSRLLLCGSGAQYGPASDHANGISGSSLLACDPTQPGSAYGEAKRASEMLAVLQAEKSGFEVVNTRCFAFVGPGLRLNGHFAIGNFIADALEHRPITLATTGHAVRSYLYGADLAVWLVLLLMESEHARGVNVGSDRSLSIVDLASRVRDVIAPDLEVRSGRVTSEGDRRFYVPDIGYARSLGLDAWTTLDQAIARTAVWQRQSLISPLAPLPRSRSNECA